MHYIVTACHHSMIFSITIWAIYKNPSLQLRKSVGDWQEQHNAQLLEVPPKMGNTPAICVTPNYSFWNPQTSPNQADLDLFPRRPMVIPPNFSKPSGKFSADWCADRRQRTVSSAAILCAHQTSKCVVGAVVGDNKIHQNPIPILPPSVHTKKPPWLHPLQKKCIAHRVVSSSKVSFATRARVTSSSEWPTATWPKPWFNGLVVEIYRKPWVFGPKYKEILRIFTLILG